ncbi:hypothetical protein A2U01_0088506, partial [Trifolium medium]|nr:hypothetical protein [Trifolium medium]
GSSVGTDFVAAVDFVEASQMAVAVDAYDKLVVDTALGL